MEYTTSPTISPAVAAWNEEYERFGKVIFPQKTSKFLVNIALIFAAILAGLFLGAGGEGIDSAVIIAAAILLPIPVLLIAWYMIWYRGTKIVVDTDGGWLTNRQLVPWSEMISSGIWSHRGTTMVEIQVTDTFMHEYQQWQSWSARMLTKMNSALIQGSALYLPQTITADPEPLAEWTGMLIPRHHASATSNIWYERDVRGLAR